MFKKIDTRTNGTIDWVSYYSYSAHYKNCAQYLPIPLLQNDFCTYMLNEYQERETMGGQRKDMFPYPLKILQRSISYYVLILRYQRF